MEKQEFKNKVDFTVNIIVDTIACFNFILGFDLKNKILINVW